MGVLDWLFKRKTNSEKKLSPRNNKISVQIPISLPSKIHVTLTLESKEEKDQKLKKTIIEKFNEYPEEFTDLFYTLDIFKEITLSRCGHWGDREVLEKFTSCQVCQKKQELVECKDLQLFINNFKAYHEECLRKLEKASTLAEMQTHEKEYNENCSQYIKHFLELKNKQQTALVLDEIKQQLGADPPELTFKHPSLTPCGHLVDFATLSICPTCYAPLEKKPVLKDSHITRMIARLKQERKNIFDSVKNLVIYTDNAQKLIAYAKAYKKEEQEKLHPNETKNHEYQTYYFQNFYTERVEALKLDRRNPLHLKFWHNQTDPGCCGTGGVELPLGNTVYRIPQTIFNLMKAIEKPFTSADEFLICINRKRSERLNWFNTQIMRRGEASTQVYTTDQIETLRLD